MRRCCKAMGALVAPALARSGLYGVCYLRHKHDMRRPGLWPQPEYDVAHRAGPAVARQLVLSWNTDGNTRPRSFVEWLINKHSLPRGFVIIDPNEDHINTLSLSPIAKRGTRKIKNDKQGEGVGPYGE